MVTLTTGPIDLAALDAAVADPACGGVVTFVGRVRNHHRGREVGHLEYEAYEPMAVERLEALVATAKERWSTGPIAVAHRLGRLEIGDVAVAIAVGAGHRAEAFEACRFMIESIKHDVPIWKREVWADGATEWVGPDAAADTAHNNGRQP